MRTGPGLVPLPDLDEHLARWVEDGVVTPDQAEGIRAEERALTPAGPLPRASLLTEALGYVGGLLVVIAALLLAARVWPDLAVGARLALVLAGAVLLLGAGALLPAAPRTASARLRSAVWGLSTGAAAFFVGLVGYEVLDLRGADLALVVTSCSAVHAAGLWRYSRAFAQEAVCFATLAGTAASALAQLETHGETRDTLPGLGIAAVGTVWLWLAVQERLGPGRMSLLLGGVGVLVGAVLVQPSDWGRFVALSGVLALVALALRIGDLALLGVGALGILMVLPVAMNEWFPGAVAAPLALLVSGAVLVLLALRALRGRASG